jgi:hypothetical protein
LCLPKYFYKGEKLMSMEDLLKVLVDSRQQGNSSSQGGDAMTNLVGSLLGGGSSNQSSQGGGLGDMMGVLESVMGGNAQGGSDPIMAILTPFVTPLAKKANIPPEIAMMVVSFVAHKLLAHHPSSGRDSNSFDFDELFNQMADGKINSNLLQSSGMVTELSRKTGLDEATAAKSLDLAFVMVGKGAGSLLNKSAANKPAASAAKPAVAKLKSGAKSGAAKKSPKK